MEGILLKLDKAKMSFYVLNGKNRLPKDVSIF